LVWTIPNCYYITKYTHSIIIGKVGVTDVEIIYYNTFELRFSKPLNATHKEQKSASIEATMKELWTEALKFSNTFPMEKPFNYNSLKLTCWHKARQVSHPNTSSIITIILCTKIIMNIKRGFPSCCCCFSEFLVELYIPSP